MNGKKPWRNRGAGPVTGPSSRGARRSRLRPQRSRRRRAAPGVTGSPPRKHAIVPVWGARSRAETCAERWRARGRRPQILNSVAELLRHRDVLQPHVLRQAVLERREVLAADQRREIGARLRRDAEAVRGDEVARQHLFDVGDLRRAAPAAIFQRYGLSDVRTIAGITALRARERELDRGLADRVAVLEIGLRRDMPRRALQVVGDRPVILVAELVLDERRRSAARRRPVARGRTRPCVPASAISLPSAFCSPSDTPTQQ